MEPAQETALRRRIDHILSQHFWLDKDDTYCACTRQVSDMDAHRAGAVQRYVSELLDAEDAEISARQGRIDAVQKIHYPEHDQWGGIQCASCRDPYPCDTVKAVRGEPDDSSNLSTDVDVDAQLRKALADIGVDAEKLHEEILLLNEENNRLRAAWKSARARARIARSAWRCAEGEVSMWREESARQDTFAVELWNMLRERRQERDRYRSAWLSARARAKNTPTP